MKNRTVAVILAISGILLGVAVYKTIAANASKEQEIVPSQGISDPIVKGPSSSKDYNEEDEDDFFSEED